MYLVCFINLMSFCLLKYHTPKIHRVFKISSLAKSSSTYCTILKNGTGKVSYNAMFRSNGVVKYINIYSIITFAMLSSMCVQTGFSCSCVR